MLTSQTQTAHVRADQGVVLTVRIGSVHVDILNVLPVEYSEGHSSAASTTECKAMKHSCPGVRHIVVSDLMKHLVEELIGMVNLQMFFLHDIMCMVLDEGIASGGLIHASIGAIHEFLESTRSERSQYRTDIMRKGGESVVVLDVFQGLLVRVHVRIKFAVNKPDLSRTLQTGGREGGRRWFPAPICQNISNPIGGLPT